MDEVDFLNFLRGMETFNVFHELVKGIDFLNFLRGMETCIVTFLQFTWFCFLNFLRGMETRLRLDEGRVLRRLPKLP